MVTRRAVLRGTAAASIGAIAAAHGATPAEAADSFGAGFGELEGGAVGGFWKFRDAFQVSLKFHKAAAEIFFKEDVSGSVAVFFKFFDKAWTENDVQFIDSKFFPDLKTSLLGFSKLDVQGAELFLKKDGIDNHFYKGTIVNSTDGVSFELEQVFND
jgi:hypothetical protein